MRGFGILGSACALALMATFAPRWAGADGTTQGPAPVAPDAMTLARVAALEAASQSVQAALRRARAVGDTSQASCLSDALTRIHVATRSSRELREAIDDARRRGDQAALGRNVARFAFLGERSGRLIAEARACTNPVPEPADGQTRVTVRAPSLPSAESYPSANH